MHAVTGTGPGCMLPLVLEVNHLHEWLIVKQRARHDSIIVECGCLPESGHEAMVVERLPWRLTTKYIYKCVCG